MRRKGREGGDEEMLEEWEEVWMAQDGSCWWESLRNKMSGGDVGRRQEHGSRNKVAGARITIAGGRR